MARPHPGFKFCRRCRQLLPIRSAETGEMNFGVDKRSLDKLHSYCKACRRDQNKLRDRAEVQELRIRVSTEYPSRVSVQEHLRVVADELTAGGQDVVIITPRGKEMLWKELE